MLQYNTKPKLTSRRKDTTRNRYKDFLLRYRKYGYEDYSSTSHSTNCVHNYNNSSRCPYGNKYYNVIPLYSILALLLVGMIGNPYVVDSRVYAQEDGNSTSNSTNTNTNTNTMGSSNSYEDVVREKSDGNEVGVANEDIIRESSEGDVTNVDSTNYTISRAVSPSTSLTITTPNLSTIAPVGEVSYLSSNVTYSANDISSYSMKISYAEGNSSLSNSNITDSSGNTTTITGAGGKTPASMSSNTWGYALADTSANNASLTYNTMPAYGSGATIVSGNAESVPTTTKKLVFASKFAENATSGHYRTKVLLSLTATPKVVAGLDSITYMQEMTGEVCSHSPEGTTKRLIDNRDGNKYWVAKLKDNNCWMVQNLAYNGGGTSTSSPLTWKDTLDDNYYYNPGQYVYTTPMQSNNCDSQKGLSACTGSGWSNVSGMIAYDVPNAPAIVNGNYYDAHYLSGNYYNWQAVNTGSICPTNWKIPEGGSTATGSSFHNLFSGLSSAFSQTINDNLTLAPYYFIRAGHIMSNKLQSAGQVGVYWTNTQSGTIDSAFGAHVGVSSPTPSASWGRYNGSSVRCVAL